MDHNRPADDITRTEHPARAISRACAECRRAGRAYRAETAAAAATAEGTAAMKTATTAKATAAAASTTGVGRLRRKDQHNCQRDSQN